MDERIESLEAEIAEQNRLIEEKDAQIENLESEIVDLKRGFEEIYDIARYKK